MIQPVFDKILDKMGYTFGISAYLYKENENAMLQYIELAVKYDFRRVFTNLLMLEEGKEQKTLLKMKKAILKAREHNMVVMLDINPGVFEQLNIRCEYVAFFKEIRNRHPYIQYPLYKRSRNN